MGAGLDTARATSTCRLCSLPAEHWISLQGPASYCRRVCLLESAHHIVSKLLASTNHQEPTQEQRHVCQVGGLGDALQAGLPLAMLCKHSRPAPLRFQVRA